MDMHNYEGRDKDLVSGDRDCPRGAAGLTDPQVTVYKCVTTGCRYSGTNPECGPTGGEWTCPSCRTHYIASPVAHLEGAGREAGCVFCDIVAGNAPAQEVVEYPGATAFRPLNPITPGHMLVVPNVHVAHAAEEPEVTAKAMEAASRYAAEHFDSFNLITSANEAATQTVYHLHIHVIPRRFGDGLTLPWTAGHDAGATPTEVQR